MTPRQLKTGILIVGDAAAAYLALYGALLIRYGRAGAGEEWLRHVGPFSAVFAVWVMIIFMVGLYDAETLRSRIELATRSAEALAAAGLASMAIFYFTPGIGIAPKTNLLAVLGLYALLFTGWRLFTRHVFSRTGFQLRVAFLGGEEARELSGILATNPHLGYTSVGVHADDPAKLPNCELLVVSEELLGRSDLTRHLYRKSLDNVAVAGLADFYEKIRHSVPESVLNERWVVEHLAGQDSAVYEHAKRLIDIAFVLFVTLPAVALTLPTAAAIWLEDRGPVLFRQRRVGRAGRPFTMVKFRSMRVDAEKQGAAFAQPGDPRVTRVGRFLRSTRLDEIPQLWNILCGEMSVVGPRPERPEIEAELTETIPLFPVRRLVRPGLTGWAQISAPYAATREDHLLKLRHDLYYLKHRSLALDAAIVLKTIYSVLKRKGR